MDMKPAERPPFNRSYFAYVLRKAHIRGHKGIVESATLRKDVDTTAFFDLDNLTAKLKGAKPATDIL